MSEELAREFHETYERLAPSFKYETRPDTREFDPESRNGRLMIEVCSQVFAPSKKRIAALENAIGNYLGAIAERNSWAYPEPDERMRMAIAIDNTQATMFALLEEQGE